MDNINLLVELHYFSGGLKTSIFGADARPNWLPAFDQVGLHNDVYLNENEFVIELSRHQRDGKFITWVGVYSSGKDAVYGDRSNYIGLGVWLVNLIPINSYLIVDALYKICKALTQNGPNQHLNEHCKQLVENKSYLQNWVTGTSILPSLDEGLVFDSSQHPETTYINCSNAIDDILIRKIADSILLNCIKADDAIKSKSRILYLLLDQSTTSEKSKQASSLSVNLYPVKLVLDYFNIYLQESRSTISSFNDRYLESKKVIDHLVEKNHELEGGVERLQLQNKEIDQQKQNLINNYKELEIKHDALLKSRSPNQLLQQLRNNIQGINNSDVSQIESILNLISEIDKSMVLSTSIDYRDNQETVTHEVKRVSQDVIRIHQGINKISQEITGDVKNIENRILSLTSQFQELKTIVNKQRQISAIAEKSQNDFGKKSPDKKYEELSPVTIGVMSFIGGVALSILGYVIWYVINK
ncbi:MAG: hypothetical protein NTY69_10840 [Methylococcales bacterium]|nr:hypothetical protein [Methylococcales bacterium]